MDEHLLAYRQHLVLAEQKAHEDFDKSVLSLSGGALGVSFAFLEKIVGAGPASHKLLILIAWFSWSLSITVVLASYFISHIALRRTMLQVDENKIYGARPGGIYSSITDACNVISGILFLSGVIVMALFVNFNLK